MKITASHIDSSARQPASGSKLLEASGMQLPSQTSIKHVPLPQANKEPVAREIPVVKEKVNLHGHTKELSDAAQAEIGKLKARDTQVHQHEQAHLSAAGGLNVSNASFTYQRGPNGVSYAVGGEVRIDTSPGATPEETLAKAQQIQDVALAPADPSAVDRSVAAKAQNMAMQARMEIAQQERQANAESHTERQHNIKQVYDSSETVSDKVNIYV